ncbi:MAG TPA: glycosyl transferase family 4, partial [Candidatus Pacearchaeota archaeon]|nr:glycosyl transferase family 4 [Candidatus Pacearchaeota archaeon]
MFQKMLFEFLIALLHVFVAFFLCFFFCKIWIKTARKNRLVGKDMNKYKKTSVAEAGGIAVILSIVFSTALYIFFKTFILKSLTNLVEILTFIVTILLACFIGFVDDILGWKKGLRQWQKPLLTIPIAIPLMVINAGHS